MVIKFFKSSFYLQYVLLLLMAAGLWIRPCLDTCPLVSPGPESPLFQLLLEIMPANGLLLALTGFILLIIEAFYLNYILIKHEIVPKNSLITAFIYVLVMSQSLLALNLNPVLCAAFFIIPAFDRILSTYGTPDPTKDVYSAAFLLALASLFHFAGIFFIILLILSFVVFGTFSIRMIFVSVAGVFTVYLYLFLYYFLANMLEGQWCLYINWFSHVPEFNTSLPLIQYGIWGMMLALFLDTFFFAAARMNEWNIKVRKMILLSIYFVFIGLGSMIYLIDDLHMAMMMISIPTTIFIAGYLSVKRKVTWFLEIYIIAWYILSFVNNLLIE